MKHSRRQFLTSAIPVTVGAIGLSSTSLSSLASGPSERRLKILSIGAHPDDPETNSGGVMALYASLGHEVVSVYLTRGEAGIEGKSYTEAASIRTAEALEACRILKVRAEFLGQIDGNCEVNKTRFDQMNDFILKENPDIILTHWPLDTHRDHRICSILVFDAWLNQGRKAALYYCESMTGVQSQNFYPTDYFDITAVIDIKHKACSSHISQKIMETYEEHHGKMERFRGMETGCEYAESYIRQMTLSNNNLDT